MTYRSEVLADNPSHYWPLSEPGGTIVADLMDPGGAGGSVNASVGYKGITATDGAALVNDINNNAYLGLKNKLYAAPPCTFEAWVWIWGTLGTYQEILMYGDTTHSMEMDVESTGKLRLVTRGTNQQLLSVGILTPSAWHHVVGLWSLTAATIYIDGTFDNNSAIAYSGLPASDPFGIGGFTDRTQPLNGYVASPALYPTVLSAARILAHFNAAEFRTQQPTFVGGASALSIVNLQADLDAKLDLILASVRKTYVAP